MKMIDKLLKLIPNRYNKRKKSDFLLYVDKLLALNKGFSATYKDNSVNISFELEKSPKRAINSKKKEDD